MEIGAYSSNGTCKDTVIFHTPVVIVSMMSCSLSILGAFVIFGTYIFIPEIRNPTRKLVTCLTVADLLTALGYLLSASAYFIGSQVQEEICLPQSVITTYSSLVSFFLTVAIAIHLFVVVIYRDDRTSGWAFFLFANAISWIIPGVIITAAGCAGVLGSVANVSEGTGPWCWLKDDHPNYTFWVFFTGKGWEFMCYLLTTSLYVILRFYKYLRLRFGRFSDIHPSLREGDQNYLYVWFVLYVLRLWGSIRSMMSLAGVDNDCNSHAGHMVSEVFLYLQAYGDPGQAFCNCILFCLLDRTVRLSLFGNYLTGRQREHLERIGEREALLQSGSMQRYSNCS